LKSGFVERPQLLQLFLSGAHRQLTLVEAPAGYGKTTLLKSWQHHFEAAGIATTWITIDPALNDFEVSLEAALAKRARELSDQMVGLTEKRAFLFLDDFHEAGSFETQTISQLLQRGGHNFHIIIGTRMPPAFPLAKLRLSGQVTDFGLEEL